MLHVSFHVTSMMRLRREKSLQRHLKNEDQKKHDDGTGKQMRLQK